MISRETRRADFNGIPLLAERRKAWCSIHIYGSFTAVMVWCILCHLITRPIRASKQKSTFGQGLINSAGLALSEYRLQSDVAKGIPLTMDYNQEMLDTDFDVAKC